MKILKKFLWASGVLLALAVGAVVVLATLVDPNDYKPKITALVKEHTGRELNWHGDLELAFFPWLGVKTGRVELFDGEGFGSEPMLAVDEAAIKIKLLPLLRKRVEADTVLLKRPQIRLSRKADGVANWDDLTAKARGGGGGTDNKKSLPDAALPAGLAVRGISIQDGWVDWDDRVAGQSLTLSALNLNTGTLVPGVPLEVDLSVEVEGSMLPERAAITLVTTAGLAENLESISLTDTDLRVTTESITADFSTEKISYALRAGLAALVGLRGTANHGKASTHLEIPSLNFNLSDESLQIPQVKLEQGDFQASGKISGSELLSAIELGGNLNLNAGNIADLLQRNGLDPDLIGMTVDDVDASFDFAFSDDTVEVKQLSAKLLLNRQPTRISIPQFDFTLADEGIKLPAVNLTQQGFTFFGSVDGNGILSDISAMTAGGSVDARSDDVANLLERNNFVIASLPGLPDSVAVGFEFDLADSTLILSDLAVESLEEQGGEVLLERREIVIPLTSDGAPAYDLVLAGLLRAQAERKLNEWLLGQIVPNGDAETETGNLKKTLKKKLKGSLFKALKIE